VLAAACGSTEEDDVDVGRAAVWSVPTIEYFHRIYKKLNN